MSFSLKMFNLLGIYVIIICFVPRVDSSEVKKIVCKKCGRTGYSVDDDETETFSKVARQLQRLENLKNQNNFDFSKIDIQNVDLGTLGEEVEIDDDQSEEESEFLSNDHYGDLGIINKDGCMGSLITKFHVLAPAHCFEGQ